MTEPNDESSIIFIGPAHIQKEEITGYVYQGCQSWNQSENFFPPQGYGR
jgi:hypothetical protein